MTDDSLNRLAMWLGPASIQLELDQLDAFSEAISDLIEKEAVGDLVEAAHGVISETARAALAEAVISHDPRFVARDKDELVARLACATLIKYLEVPGAENVIRIAAMIQSAHFAGMRPRIEELLVVAERIIDEAGISARERSPLSRTQRKTLSPEATIAEAVSMINSVAKRTYDDLVAMETRLRLMDEEINTLWWARSARSRSRDMLWSSMENVDRVVSAALEMKELLSFYPPTAAQLALLHDVAGEEVGSVTLAELGKALAGTEIVNLPDNRLIPLVTAAKIWQENGTEPKVAAALYRKAGFDPKLKVQLRTVAEQLLRERHLAVSL